ncbi:hypothetical protein AH580_19545 [Salmonella enterica subsp. enterica serovar Montevideo]|uniref:hypothetical protein n=1 Tax=Salmonella enterica TaxID=28901 RepID=UPI0009AFAD78|nr:hypothetical protein [Salmonella enterica]EBZ2217466.1 hypothetical protein [Salmonella enterica subsp. enterica serovar Montevideo]ECA9146965.1 hypothetical protein [Salmonella enterica subsp. enterica serovar Montevideo]EDE7749351.1 hypothetical protein [Salmonella enterica subsp. enterica serovar Montevideo]EEK7292515.1 hypothetical protein [Salmonella enterica subsp. enterica serovar Montevideo]
MLKKAKIYKAVISVIALFSFVNWGLDPNVICKVVSETPQVCGYSEHSLIMNVFGSSFAFILTAMATTILVLWVKND